MPADNTGIDRRKEAKRRFEEELARRGVAYEPGEEGLYYLRPRESGRRISIENLVREFARDGDESLIHFFVDNVLSPPKAPRSWSEAGPGIFISAEATECIPDSALARPVSNYVAGLAVHLDQEERRVASVGPEDLARWRVDEKTVLKTADANMSAFLERTPLEVAEPEGHRLAMFSTQSVLKASVIFAPNLRSKLEPVVGWPALFVIPCRDFAYAFAEGDDWLLGRLGATVLKEFEGSGYPLTPEVLQVSDDGIEAIGSFAE